MTPPRRSLALLIVAALLFVGWIGWLGYLALTATQPIVLSRPQFLVSQVDVEADLTGNADHPEESVTRAAVLWVREPKDSALKGQPTVVVSNLPRVTAADGWSGPDRYILPLIKEDDGTYRVAPIPRSPGFPGRYDHPRIYRATPQTLEQHRQMRP